MLYFVIDGHNFLHRTLNIPDLAIMTHNNIPTGGIYGFLRSMNTIVHSVPKQEIKVIVVWDGKRSKRRLKLYPDYKGNRHTNEPSDEVADYYARFNIQQKVLKETFLPALGVLSVTAPDREGDDVVYLVCSLFRLDNDIIVISEDRDMFQLITHFPNVRIYRPISKTMVNCNNFREHALCNPKHYLMYKALKGDASDNIDGLPLIGPKTASKIVAQANPDSQKEFFDWVQAQYQKERTKAKRTRISGVYDNWGTYSRNLELIDLSREEFSGHEQEVITKAIENHKSQFFEDYFKHVCDQYGISSLQNEFAMWKDMFSS